MFKKNQQPNFVLYVWKIILYCWSNGLFYEKDTVTKDCFVSAYQTLCNIPPFRLVGYSRVAHTNRS